MSPTISTALPPRVATAGFATATTAWLLVLLVSPYLVSHTRPGSPLFTAGGIAYMAGRTVCHQRAERSFHAWGVQLPVCGRCLGLYAAAVLGSLFAAWRSRRQSGGQVPLSGSPAGSGQAREWRRRLAVAALPTVASVGLETGRIWAQSPAVRCVAAIPLGFTVAWFVGVYAPEVLSRRPTPHSVRSRSSNSCDRL